MAVFINSFINFGAYLSIMTFFAYIILRKNRNENFYHSLSFVCFGFLLFKIHSAVVPVPTLSPPFWLYYLSIPYFPVPLLYFGYCRAVTFENRISLRKVLVLCPSLLVLIFDLSSSFLPLNDNHFFVRVIIAGAFVQAAAFLVIMAKKLSILLKVKRYYLIIRITMGYIVLAGIAYFLVISGWIFEKAILLQAGGAMVTVLLAGNYLMDLRNGEFRHLLILEANKELNKFTLLKDVDVEGKIARLESYMKESRLYLDENLSLADLSLRLNLSTHQLSQLINDRYQMNFNTFINSYRIKEAERLLLSAEEQTILSITYAAGFNSKTAFYNAFYRFTGCTPQKYRSSHGAVESGGRVN